MASVRLNGDTSGFIEISAPNVAGSTTITLPATSGGNFLVTDSNGDINVDSGTLFVDASTNRVGIGTTGPATNLHIAGASDPTLTITASTFQDDCRIEYRDDSNITRGGIYYSTNDFSLQFRNGANNSEGARLDGSNRLLVGTTSARSNIAGITPGIQLEGANNNTPRSFGQIYGKSDAAGPLFLLAKHRSDSVGGQTVVSSGDELGQIVFTGSDGSNFVQGATIKGAVDGTPGSNDMPGRLVFSTTADGASSPTEQMRLTSTGDLRFNSGYGSVATAYGVRAWVNFQGTSTVTIRESGNVSSITDDGTGDYRINFTNAMPDDNYGVAPCSYAQSGSSMVVVLKFKSASGHPMTTNWVAVVSENTSGRLDIEFCCVAIFR